MTVSESALIDDSRIRDYIAGTVYLLPALEGAVKSAQVDLSGSALLRLHDVRPAVRAAGNAAQHRPQPLQGTAAGAGAGQQAGDIACTITDERHGLAQGGTSALISAVRSAAVVSVEK